VVASAPSSEPAPREPAAIEPAETPEPDRDAAGPQAHPFAVHEPEITVAPAAAVVPSPPAVTPAPAFPVPIATMPNKPKTEPKPKAVAKVTVHIRAIVVAGEIKLGGEVYDVSKSVDVKLPVGRHAVAWRFAGASTWTKAPTLKLTAGRRYVLRLGGKGLWVGSDPEEKP